jgi:hypothetical protein
MDPTCFILYLLYEIFISPIACKVMEIFGILISTFNLDHPTLLSPTLFLIQQESFALFLYCNHKTLRIITVCTLSLMNVNII